MFILPSSVTNQDLGAWTKFLKSRVLSPAAATRFPYLLLLVFVLLANPHLSTFPLLEWGDVALNALQVQNAKHLHELLGNYSRWQFHHPGPFFFYIFAAGEAVFYDFLHLVAAPLNGEILAEIIFAVICLYLAQRVLSAHIQAPIFLPLSILATLIFLSVLETAAPGSALVSVWPPFMAIFSFLLFAIACASVASGRWNHVPMMVFAASVMIHSHVAQVFFATCLMSFAVGSAVVGELLSGTLRHSLCSHRRSLIWAVVIAGIFAFPVVLEALIDKPNNIDLVRRYLRQHHGEHNSMRMALLYTLSFFTYNTSPDTLLASGHARVKDFLRADSFVILYWTGCLCLMISAVALYLRCGPRIPRMLWMLAAEVGLITVLFLYWSRRMTGPMFMFNGFFFYSVQLIILLLACGCIAVSVPVRFGGAETAPSSLAYDRDLTPALIRRCETLAACCLTPLVLLIPGIRARDFVSPQAQQSIDSIRASHKKAVELVFDQASWPDAAAVASNLTRNGISFCVKPEWGFFFRNVCQVPMPPEAVIAIGHLNSFSEQVSSLTKSLEMNAGGTSSLRVNVKNTGGEVWYGDAPEMPVDVGYRWLDKNGNFLKFEGTRAHLDKPYLAPGGSASATLTVTAPSQPGSYTLCVSMVNEGFAWFDDMGGTPLRLPVKVR